MGNARNVLFDFIEDFSIKKKKNPEKRASSEALSIQHSLAANRIKSGCY